MGDNVSGHSPIYIKLNIGTIPVNETSPRTFLPKQNWKKVTDDDKSNFELAVEESVSSLEIPAAVIDCQNVNCTDLDHRVDIDTYTKDIVKCLETSAANYIPYTRPKQGSKVSKRKVVPGWVELVKPHQDKAKFWYQVCLINQELWNCLT